MSEWIHCIDSDIWKNKDGSMDCFWLTPYFGDMTEEEYKAAGTALSIKRGCQYCYDMFEWKTRLKEECWNDNETVCQGYHPDWPGEITQISKVVDSSGKLIGYETQHKLFGSLHELEFYGWELRYDYCGKGRKIYEEEEPVSFGCGPKESVNWCSINHSGRCSLDTAGFEDMDRLAGRCGFIRVNDRYLMWKYGVPFKDLDCGHCAYYASGQFAYGTCEITHESICKHCKTCRKFIKIGGEKVAKQNYWAKCGREFQKSSTAEVTSHIIDENDKECANCPFQIEVTEGWGDNKKHVRWECRAGSLAPNQKDDWVGDLDGNANIHIHSLHNDFFESVLEYCKEQPDLSAGYNQDTEDCRRQISVSCSANKKGIAAKKALVEKFFPATNTALEPIPEIKPCPYFDGITKGNNGTDLEEQMDELLKNGDEKDKVAKDQELLFNIIGKEIRTQYNTGGIVFNVRGIVFNVSGPYNAYSPGSWSINYSDDGKKHKKYGIINSIKVENGVITCDGKPLQIIEKEESIKPLNTEQIYIYRGLV